MGNGVKEIGHCPDPSRTNPAQGSNSRISPQNDADRMALWILQALQVALRKRTHNRQRDNQTNSMGGGRRPPRPLRPHSRQKRRIQRANYPYATVWSESRNLCIPRRIDSDDGSRNFATLLPCRGPLKGGTCSRNFLWAVNPKNGPGRRGRNRGEDSGGRCYQTCYHFLEKAARNRMNQGPPG